MKPLTSLIAVLMFALVAIAAEGKRQEQEEAVREAVFRYQFTNNTAHGAATAEKKIAATKIIIVFHSKDSRHV